MSKIETTSFGRFQVGAKGDVDGVIEYTKSSYSINLHSSTPIPIVNGSGATISGQLRDGRSIVALNCYTLTSGSSGVSHFAASQARVTCSHLVIGDTKFDNQREEIALTCFTTDDSSILFYDFDAFGLAHSPQGSIEQLLRENERVSKRPIDEAHFQNPTGAFIFYFSGRDVIFKSPVEWGQVSAKHRPNPILNAARGFNVHDEVLTEIAFNSAVSIDQALDSVEEVACLWGLICGRPQNYTSKVSIRTRTGHDFEVHYSKKNERSTELAEREPQPAGILLDPIDDQEEFANIVAA